MKIIYLLVPVISLLFIGCSTTFTVKDFSSKEKYYQDFNNFARNKIVKVVLLNDSSFSIDSGSAIENDSLYYLTEDILTGNMKLALSDTKEIIYTGNDYKSAVIILMNEEKYYAKQINITHDSISFVYTKEVIILHNITSVNKIKEINYKNRWLGIPTGLFFGTISGLAIGLTGVIPVYTASGSNSNTSTRSYFGSVAIGLESGLAIGTIAGWLIGNNYTYQFNP